MSAFANTLFIPVTTVLTITHSSSQSLQYSPSHTLHPNHYSIIHQFLKDFKKKAQEKSRPSIQEEDPNHGCQDQGLGLECPCWKTCLQKLQRTLVQRGKVLVLRTSHALLGAFPSQQFPVCPSSSQSSQATGQPFHGFTSQENVGPSSPSSFRKTQTTWSNTLRLSLVVLDTPCQMQLNIALLNPWLANTNNPFKQIIFILLWMLILTKNW